MHRRISYLIPTLNEAATLEACICSIIHAVEHEFEIIIADGGSRDGTMDIASKFSVVQARTSPRRGRSMQLNDAASIANGDVLFFIHADTCIPKVAPVRVLDCMNHSKYVGGGFIRRFTPSHPLLAITSRLADIRSRTSGYFFGDQTLFVAAETFHDIGGYRDMELFEDFDLCRRMKKKGKLVALSPPVLSSSRRFYDQKFLYSVVREDARLTLAYMTGRHSNAKQ